MSQRTATSRPPETDDQGAEGVTEVGVPSEALQALRESEERYRKLVELSPDGIYVHRDGLILFANPAAKRLLGGEGVEVVGRSIFELVPEEMHGEVAGRIEAANQAGSSPYHQVTRFKRLDGSKACFEGFSVPITYEGQPARQAVIWDTTDRVRNEEELRRSRQELRRLAAHLQSVREEEQGRIAREIHDELGQSLTALKLDLAWVRRRLAGDREPDSASGLEERLESMSELVDSTLSSVRRLALELRPGVLDDLGLEAAVEWQVEEFAQRTGAQCQYRSDLGACNIDSEVATATYRILQESLTNVARHSGADRVEVTLRCDQEGLWLEVRDNGQGFEMKTVRDRSSVGLLTMYERARACEGHFDVRSIPGEGTTVSLRVPEPSRRRRKRRRA